MQNKLEKSGSFGSILAAAACPVCFPKLALFGAIFGFGALAKYETLFFFATQILVVLALVGHGMSFRRHGNKGLLGLSVVSVVLFFLSLYAFGGELLTYTSFTGLIVATIWLMRENRRCQSCETVSTVSPE